jgi:transcriptional regulator with PAS, ATPase and Fis domain
MNAMAESPWVREFPGAITVCDAEGIILSMNDKSIEAFEAQGGRGLIGSNLLDCHPEPARSKLRRLLESQEKNVYTIEEAGARKLIYQTPWYCEGKYAGLVEIALEIPSPMPHFLRDG